MRKGEKKEKNEEKRFNLSATKTTKIWIIFVKSQK
jgi:hypothetical protein